MNASVNGLRDPAEEGQHCISGDCFSFGYNTQMLNLSAGGCAPIVGTTECASPQRRHSVWTCRSRSRCEGACGCSTTVRALSPESAAPAAAARRADRDGRASHVGKLLGPPVTQRSADSAARPVPGTTRWPRHHHLTRNPVIGTSS